MNNLSGYHDSIANIPGTSIHVYSILMAVAILAVVFSSWYKMYRRNIPTRTLEWSVLIIVPCGLIGARLWFVLNNLDLMNSFMDVIAVWNGGLAVHGGVITGLIIGWFIFYRASLKYRISMWVYLDCILPNILLGQAIGRWGNFFNQEILGADNGQPFGFLPSWINNNLHFPNDTIAIYRQPLFLYESFFSFLGWIILTFVVPKMGSWFSKKPWKVNASEYRPLWKTNPIVASDYYQPWKIIKKLYQYRYWKQKCWNQVYYDFEPVNLPVKDVIIRPFKPVKITPNTKLMKKLLIKQKNFYLRITNNFYQDASLLNKSYNPQQYRLTASGVSGSLYLVFYGIIRVIIEPLRDSRDMMMIGFVPTSILVSILWIIVGLVLVIFAQFIARNKFRKKGWLYERQY